MTNTGIFRYTLKGTPESWHGNKISFRGAHYAATDADAKGLQQKQQRKASTSRWLQQRNLSQIMESSTSRLAKIDGQFEIAREREGEGERVCRGIYVKLVSITNITAHLSAIHHTHIHYIWYMYICLLPRISALIALPGYLAT